MSDKSNYDIKSYDIYNKGYKSGAQAYVFLGPIWIEETSFFQIDRSDTKRPVYGYNEVKFDRLIQGRYLVQGTLGINYVEANYLLKIIKQVQDQSVMRGTLQDLIVNRKSIFLERMRSSEILQKMISEYGLESELEGITKIEKFVKRLCNEAELASANNKPLDPHNFELTFIYGDLYDTTQSIEIYEGVQVTSSGMRSGNDDNVTMEMYNWTARGMKEVEVQPEKEVFNYGLSKSNLLTMAKEIADKLIDQVLEDPVIDVHANTQRTKLMNNTMKLGLAGALHPRTRMFGKSASFIEMVYALELPQIYGMKSSRKTTDTSGEITSDTKLEISVKKSTSDTTTVEKDRNIKLIPPTHQIFSTGGDVTAFDNTFGKISSINIEHTAEKIKAISPVEIQELEYRLGGSIALPRYNRTNFNIGSFVPPTLVPNDEANPFIFEEKDMESITYSTLWCCLTGYRGIGNSTTVASTEKEEQNIAYLNEISQPLYSFAYLKETKGEYVNEGDYTLQISAPIYVDFLNLHKSSGEVLGKRAKSELMSVSDSDMVNFTYGSTGTPKSVGLETEGGENDNVFRESLITASYKYITVDKMVSYTDILPTVEISGETTLDFSDFDPNFFQLSLQNNSAMLATDFHKALYLVPFVFEEKDGETLPEPDPTVGELTVSESIKNLTYLLSTRGNADDSCKYNMDYDWVCTDISGIQTVNGSITVNGVYFINPKELSSVGKNLHVIWIMTLIPVKRQTPTTTEGHTSDINIIHDISTLGGRYAEFYNITRCDNMYHIESIYDMYDPNDNIVEQIIRGIRDIFDGIKNIFNKSYESNYALPVKRSLDRICGFMDGYAVTINVANIVDQILKCGFTSSETVRECIGKKEGTITLKDALIKASGSETSGDAVTKEIASIVTSSLESKMEIKGANILKNSDNKYITIEMHVPTPPTDLISWGLLTDGSGAAELLEIRKKNQEYKKDSEAQPEEQTSTTITLGGYSAII